MIFPLYFDADPIVKSADDSDFTAATSSVELDGSGGSVDITLNDAEKVGTLIHFYCSNASTNPTVTLKNAAGGTDRDVITFTSAGVAADCIWTEDGWRVVALDAAESVVA